MVNSKYRLINEVPDQKMKLSPTGQKITVFLNESGEGYQPRTRRYTEGVYHSKPDMNLRADFTETILTPPTKHNIPDRSLHDRVQPPCEG